jgi:hypothetical protein
LLLPAISAAKKHAQRTTCLNNLRQINLGARMYADDSYDAPPSSGSAAAGTNTMLLYSGYKELMKNYVGLNGASSPQDKLFACPADVFFPSFFLTNAAWPFHYVSLSFHDQPFSDPALFCFGLFLTGDFGPLDRSLLLAETFRADAVSGGGVEALAHELFQRHPFALIIDAGAPRADPHEPLANCFSHHPDS